MFSLAAPEPDPMHDGLGNRWGEMALATQSGELPTLEALSKDIGKAADSSGSSRFARSFHKDQENPDVPYWQRRQLQEQARAARNPSSKYKSA